MEWSIMTPDTPLNEIPEQMTLQDATGTAGIVTVGAFAGIAIFFVLLYCLIRK